MQTGALPSHILCSDPENLPVSCSPAVGFHKTDLEGGEWYIFHFCFQIWGFARLEAFSMPTQASWLFDQSREEKPGARKVQVTLQRGHLICPSDLARDLGPPRKCTRPLERDSTSTAFKDRIQNNTVSITFTEHNFVFLYKEHLPYTRMENTNT